MALEHGQGPQPRSAGYLKRYIFRNQYPCNGPNKLALLTPIQLKPAGSSDSVLILPSYIPVQSDQAAHDHELLQLREGHGLLVPEIQMHGQSDLSGPPPCRYTQ